MTEYNQTPERSAAAASFINAINQATGCHTDSRPYLGQYEVVEELIRSYFFGGFLERAIALGQGQLTASQAGEQNVAVCCYLARVFAGRTPENYTSVGMWNDGDGPGTLAHLVRQRIAHAVAPQHLHEKNSALQSLFSVAATDMFAAIHQFNTDGDADRLQERTEELTEDLTRLLLGLPADF